MAKKMTLKQFVKKYNGSPESWQAIAEWCAEECEECPAQKLADTIVSAMAVFEVEMEKAGFEIG